MSAQPSAEPGKLGAPSARNLRVLKSLNSKLVTMIRPTAMPLNRHEAATNHPERPVDTTSSHKSVGVAKGFSIRIYGFLKCRHAP
jgi:hypothetical protein